MKASKRRAIKRRVATEHKLNQKKKLATAITEALAAAKKAKKGRTGFIAQMEKRGYRLTITKQGNDKFIRLPKEATA